MAPLLRQGEGVLADPSAYTDHIPQMGDIVVARHPFQTDVLLIKRVAGQPTDDGYDLRGDNPGESTDSRTFGSVRREFILGRVVSRCPALRFGQGR